MIARSEVAIPQDDIRESFPARDLTFSNLTKDERSQPRGSRYMTCPECGKVFYRPTEEWGYMMQSARYERGRGRNCRDYSKAPHRFFCSYHCYRAAQRVEAEQGERERRSKYHSRTIYTTTCRSCGETFQTTRLNARYCCSGCQKSSANARARARKAAKKEATKA